MKKSIFWIIAAVCMVVGIAYFILPGDFIPDLIVFVGWLDDLLVNLLTLAGIAVNVCFALGILPLKRKEPEYATGGEYGYYEER